MLVREGELIVFDEWCCEQEVWTEGRRWRDGVSYSPPGRTSHASAPAWLSRSLLQLNIPSIGSGTCMPTECHGGIRSSQSRTLLLLLLDWRVELGSSGRGPRFLCRALEGKHEMCDGFSTSWRVRVDT